MSTFDSLYAALKNIVDADTWTDTDTGERVELKIRAPVRIVCEVNGEEQLFSFSEREDGGILADRAGIEDFPRTKAVANFLIKLREQGKELEELKHNWLDQITDNQELHKRIMVLEKQNQKLLKELDGVLITRSQALKGAKKRKLTANQVEEARQLRREGLSLRQIAQKLNVSHQTISSRLKSSPPS